MNNNKYILVDASWWQSANRHRGIGVYLKAFFNDFYDWRGLSPIWIFPNEMSEMEIRDFKKIFPNGEIVYKSTFQSNSFLTVSGRTVTYNSISSALAPSPFERPWSLLLEVIQLKKKCIPLTAILHDLLPLEFKMKILSAWSLEDQEIYLKQVKLLKYCDYILAGCLRTQYVIENIFPEFSKKSELILFGENEEWLEIPSEARVLPPPLSNPYVVTISGGEWRKNLIGTLQFFSIKFPIDWRLVIICKLGRKELVKFKILAATYGLHGRVIWTGEIPELEKWTFIINSKAPLSLSYGEGLNLPLHEARSVGLPAIVLSDLDSIYTNTACRTLSEADLKFKAN